eukprot:303346-Alexandrium_andersonii.AAC.1
MNKGKAKGQDKGEGSGQQRTSKPAKPPQAIAGLFGEAMRPVTDEKGEGGEAVKAKDNATA